MKRNFIALGALVLAIAASSFTTRFVTFKYLIYSGSGAENTMASYSQQPAQPAHILNTVTPTLNWFRVTDSNSDNIISATEFSSSFATYNVVAPASNLLKDETADVSGQLDLKNK